MNDVTISITVSIGYIDFKFNDIVTAVDFARNAARTIVDEKSIGLSMKFDCEKAHKEKKEEEEE